MTAKDFIDMRNSHTLGIPSETWANEYWVYNQVDLIKQANPGKRVLLMSADDTKAPNAIRLVIQVETRE
jgi:hypothetical protein